MIFAFNYFAYFLEFTLHIKTRLIHLKRVLCLFYLFIYLYLFIKRVLCLFIVALPIYLFIAYFCRTELQANRYCAYRIYAKIPQINPQANLSTACTKVTFHSPRNICPCNNKKTENAYEYERTYKTTCQYEICVRSQTIVTETMVVAKDRWCGMKRA